MNETTLLEALDDYQGFIAALNLSYNSRKHYTIDIKDLISYLKDQWSIEYPAHVTKDHVEHFLTELDRREFKGSTRRRKLIAIRGFFLYLAGKKIIPDNPTAKIATPLAEESDPRVLTDKEYKRLQEVVRYHPRDEAIIELLL